MNEIISITVDEITLEKIKKFYEEDIQDNNGAYVVFFAKSNRLSITAYKIKDGKSKVVFSGPNALQEARIWDINAEKRPDNEWEYFGEQIGSDEVGVGDFLLPMVVVAAYVNKKQISLLRELGVNDSKKLSDQKILEIGPRLVKEFSFSKLTLPNEKYNEMYQKGENLNSLKAKMHNRALLNMHHEHPEVINIFVDEFAKPTTYYRYLNDHNEEIVGNIIFKTKGESHFPCVALASVIARYSLLKEKEKLDATYHLDFPFGAGPKVDEFVTTFIDKYGFEELTKIAKTNFANYKKLNK